MLDPETQKSFNAILNEKIKQKINIFNNKNNYDEDEEKDENYEDNIYKKYKEEEKLIKKKLYENGNLFYNEENKLEGYEEFEKENMQQEEIEDENDEEDEVFKNLELELEYEDDQENMNLFFLSEEKKRKEAMLNPANVTNLYDKLDDFSWQSVWKLTEEYMKKYYNHFKIKVCDPEVVSSSILTKYIAYNIITISSNNISYPSPPSLHPTTTTSSATSTAISSVNHGSTTHQVKRRYKDFLWLLENLKSKYLGLCLPSLPSVENLTTKGLKILLGGEDTKNCNSNYIKSRTIQLHLFLDRLIKIPFLSNDPSLLAFLFIDNPKEFKDFMHSSVSSGASSKSKSVIKNDGLILWNCLLNRITIENFSLKINVEYKINYSMSKEDYVNMNYVSQDTVDDEDIENILRVEGESEDENVVSEKRENENILKSLISEDFHKIISLNKKKIEDLILYVVQVEKDCKIMIKQLLNSLKSYSSMNENIFNMFQIELLSENKIINCTEKKELLKMKKSESELKIEEKGNRIEKEEKILKMMKVDGDMKDKEENELSNKINLKKRRKSRSFMLFKEINENFNELLVKMKIWKNNVKIILKYYQIIFLSYFQYFLSQLNSIKDYYDNYLNNIKDIERIRKEKKKLKEELIKYNSKKQINAEAEKNNAKPSIFIKQISDYQAQLKEKKMLIYNYEKVFLNLTKILFFSEFERIEYEKLFIIENIKNIMKKISSKISIMYLKNDEEFVEFINIKGNNEEILRNKRKFDYIDEFDDYFSLDSEDLIKKVLDDDDIEDDDEEE